MVSEELLRLTIHGSLMGNLRMEADMDTLDRFIKKEIVMKKNIKIAKD
jgi:hypothetical protein